MARHCRVLGFHVHHGSALFLKGVLHNSAKNADGSDKPVLLLGRNRRTPLRRSCRYPPQLNVIEEHTMETNGEFGSEAPV